MWYMEAVQYSPAIKSDIAGSFVEMWIDLKTVEK